VKGKREGVRGVREEGEMTQTLYAHMNKIKIKKKENSQINLLENCPGGIREPPERGNQGKNKD
jgi:hypothetical protein